MAAWEQWGLRYARVGALYTVAEPFLRIPGAAHDALHAHLLTQMDAGGAAVGLFARTSVATEARRSLVALALLRAMGFGHPFSHLTFAGRAAWHAAVDATALRRAWRDGQRWMDHGEVDHRIPGTLEALIRAVNSWLKRWWGVTCQLQFGAHQIIRAPKAKPSGAAQAADVWGIVRWWRDAVPRPHKAARGY